MDRSQTSHYRRDQDYELRHSEPPIFQKPPPNQRISHPNPKIPYLILPKESSILMGILGSERLEIRLDGPALALKS